jgi:energy-coupling factor transport system ATP-binding protein
MSEAAVADRIIVLSEGRIALEGSPQAIFGDRARLQALDLDVPPVTAVAERARALGVSVRGMPLTSREFVSALG